MSTLLSGRLPVDQAARHPFASSANTAQHMKLNLNLWNYNKWQVSVEHFEKFFVIQGHAHLSILSNT